MQKEEKRMLAIFNKELKSYFYSATGYVFMGVFLLICGVFFANYNLLPSSPYYSNVLSSMLFTFLILVPVITMKLIAEEKHQKTDQLLLTAPLNTYEIVIGKYLASVALFFITLLITVLYPLILTMYGAVPAGEIAATYVGFALLGTSLIAIGLFVSSLTENQVVSAVASFGILLIIWLMDWIQKGLPATKNSGIVFAVILTICIVLWVYLKTKNLIVSVITAVLGAGVIIGVYIKNSNLYEGFVPRFFDWFSLLNRFENFAMGVLDVSSIVYYITFSIAFVYLTVQMLEKRKWN
jgi:ABC-2 type transport system permease protein